jgi:hypothetical protein
MGEESGGATSSEEGVTADETMVGSGRCVSRTERSAVVKVMDGPAKGELTIDAVTTGSCEPGEVTGISTDAEEPSRTVASGSQRVIRALTGASTSSGDIHNDRLQGGKSIIKMAMNRRPIMKEGR